MDGSQISCAALRTLFLNSREQLIREQREDPELGHIYRYLENPDDGSINATVREVITDHFTKWSELIPLRKASAQAVANTLFENYISPYGAPMSLISDNGPQFISKVIEHLSHRQLTARWSTATGVLISASSILRRLLHRGLRARVPLYKIPLTENHRRLRLQWAHEYRACQADWHQFVFSAESGFNL
ncbi:transposable element Tcb2 transposase [Trichonephila clavipes]|nr:transposable element Tcb2 transposase [Trichonephila clavipes]